MAIDLDETQFAALVAELEKTQPNQIRRAVGDVVFAQNLDLCSARLKQVSTQIKRDTSWPSVWFDGVLASDSSGVGYHCDPNDNFTFQRSGAKLWKLLNPEAVSQRAIKHTMLGEDAGLTGSSPGDALEFLVEAGDVLYIPVLWPHQGISKGRSLSFTLVANAESALALLPLLYLVLSDVDRWWLPMPTPAIVDPESGSMLPVDQEFSRAVDNLLESIVSEPVRSALKQEWWRTRYEQLTEARTVSS